MAFCFSTAGRFVWSLLTPTIPPEWSRRAFGFVCTEQSRGLNELRMVAEHAAHNGHC